MGESNNVPSGPQPVLVFIVDDHRLMHIGLKALLKDEPQFLICGGAESSEQALTLIPRHNPDIIVMDISIKGEMDGIELTRVISEKHPNIAILMLSMHEEATYAERALEAGASGYLNKCDAPELLLKALRSVLAGELFFSPQTFFGAETKLRVGVAGWRISKDTKPLTKPPKGEGF